MYITKQTRIGRARQHTGRFALGFRQGFVINPIHTQGAFLHHLLLLIQFACTVRAGPGAVLAADALVVINQHNAILLALVTGASGADRDTRCVFTVQTTLGEVQGLGVGELTDLKGLHPVEEGAGRILGKRIVIKQRAGGSGGIPLFTAGHTRVAADADVKVNH